MNTQNTDCPSLKRLVVSAIILVIGLIGGYFINYNILYNQLKVDFTNVKTIEYGTANLKADEIIKEVNGDEVKVIKEVDPKQVGKQEIIVEVKTAEITKVFKHEVEVQDTIAPEIKLKADELVLTEGEEIDVLNNIEAVVDQVDGDITYDTEEAKGHYVYSTNLDTNTPGTYDVVIKAVDNYNNVSESVYKVVVKERPRINKVVPQEQTYNNDHLPVIDTSSISSVAYSLVGQPYRSGGNSLGGFDCSGLVQYVYAQMGISISRSSRTQINDGYAVSKDAMLPGDIIIWSSNGYSPTHTSIYVGGGMMVHATNPRMGVVASNVDYWNSSSTERIIAIRRI